MKNITISGGGLAGLSLGIALRSQGVPVTLHEKGDYPRHKVCGEFICGVQEKTLKSLAINDLFSDVLQHEKIAWWMGAEKLLDEKLPCVAYGISRYLLDQRLAEKFEHIGGELKLHSRIPFSTNEGHVWAAGKPTLNGEKKWIGLKIHVLHANLDGLEMHSGSDNKKNGYVGLAQVEDKRVNCCGLFELRKEITPALAKKQWLGPAALMMAYAEATGMTRLLEMLKNWEFDEESFSATAGFALGTQPDAGGFCIGDASWLIPPFTGNGMSMALESSEIAAKWLVQYAHGELEWNNAQSGYRTEAKKHFSKRMTFSRIFHPMLFNFSGQRLMHTAAHAGILPFRSLFFKLRNP